MWRERPIAGVGYLSHLYTRIAAGRESDEIERWLDREFENPAAEPIKKATSGSRLTQEDWRHLVRFLAAQIVRTPAYFVGNFPRWPAEAQKFLDSTLPELVREFEAAKRSGKSITVPDAPNRDSLPFRITAEAGPGEDSVRLKATTVVGRGWWLSIMRHLLSGAGALRLLHEHRWSIVAPHQGSTWFTSDDPVIRLNCRGEGRYGFKGGCGELGTEIFLPLGPHHLLYTRIGHRPPPRGAVLPRAETEMIRRCIAEHAFRMIFGASQAEDVAKLRPRIVNDELLRSEREQWRNWHERQTEAEREVSGSGP